MELDNTLPFTMTVAGPSGCGKTYFILKFVEALSSQFDSIYYCYGVYQNQVNDFSNLGAHCVAGLPDVQCDAGAPILCIFDDLMLDNTKAIAKFFTKMRHANMSCIFLTQSFFFDDKYMRLITRNSHYIVLFKCPRDATVPQTLGNQMYPNNSKFFTSAFAQATDQPYGYLFVDCRSTTPDRMRLRQGILPNEHKYVFFPTSSNG